MRRSNSFIPAKGNFSACFGSSPRLSRRGLRIGIEIYEDEIEPFLGAHRGQREIFCAKILHAFDLGGAEQRAVERISPAVIAAAEEFARAAAFGRRSGAMAADVIKTSQLSVCAAHEQQGFAHQFGGEIVAGLFDLAGVTHDLPGAREDFFFFRGEDAASV